MSSIKSQSVTRALAELTVDRAHTFPTEVLALARDCLIDGFGNMLAGSAQPVGAQVREFARACGGVPESPVLGSSLRTSGPIAAFCHGTFHRALDFDNCWLPLDHPVAASHAALLSLAMASGRAVPGRELLEALVVGMETQARLRIASDLATHKAGAKGRGIFGTLAATAACCRLLGLSAQQTEMAFGISAGRAGGVDNSGTMSNPADSGLAARNGIESAMLARAGFTARAGIIEAASGFLQYLGDDADLESIVARFARPWRLAELGVAFKKYPCQYPTHWGVDAVLAALGGRVLPPDEIESLELAITVTPGHSSFNERSLDAVQPNSGLAGKFNVAYTAVVALLHGTVRIEDFSDEAVRSADIASALGKTRISLLPAITRFEDMRAQARITLRNGVILSGSMSRPHGIWGDPLTADELAAKFRDCASPALAPDEAEALRARLLTIGQDADVRSLAPLLVPQRSSA
ncbi:MAG: MmgE/PrpD family protein [Betaproteobacteria bacterium]|nr:MmgE/PrpD family protein [Betaproteobacteria bacterium]